MVFKKKEKRAPRSFVSSIVYRIYIRGTSRLYEFGHILEQENHLLLVDRSLIVDIGRFGEFVDVSTTTARHLCLLRMVSLSVSDRNSSECHQAAVMGVRHVRLAM